MTYTVWYQHPGSLFKRKIRNVEGDMIMKDDNPSTHPTYQPLGIRVFLLADKSRIEIPMTCVFRFSKERFFGIQEKMSKEAGQKIPV